MIKQIKYILFFSATVLTVILSSCSVTIFQRTHYINFNPYMIEARDRAMNDDWEGAAWIWSAMVNLGDDNIAGKAAFNMVITCEVMNRPDLAIEWAKIAAYEYNSTWANRRAKEYLDFFANPLHREIAVFDYKVNSYW
ncbi:MAG: DUF6340 family protein [Bacteroidota bacterium]